MSGGGIGGSYGGTVSRAHTAPDRFYNPPAVRRQQQQQQLLLLQQQQQQNQQQQQQEEVNNLDRFLQSVTPSVLAHFSPHASLRSWRSQEPDIHLYYGLNDLWDFFGEWSVYGVGVPLVMNENESIVQYYVPSLSGLQLYVDPVKIPSRCRRSGEESNVQPSRETSSRGNSDYEAESGNTHGALVFEYMERDSPHHRKPLTEKISALASEHPYLRKYKSCDLLPSSWISVAWYPIYRIPVGPTLKDLGSSFLTFHFLSTSSTNNCQLRSHGAGGRKADGDVEASLKVSLPVFGLASYKGKSSQLSPFGPLEYQQENTLLEAANTWLTNLQAVHPDYLFFKNPHAHRN